MTPAVVTVDQNVNRAPSWMRRALLVAPVIAVTLPEKFHSGLKP
jgi:hypothetical protein